MGIAASLRRASAPVTSALNARLETLFRHVTNEARDTRESVGARIDGLQSETHRVHDRMYEIVDPAMTTVAEASTLLQHAALRVERRLAELGASVGEPGPAPVQIAGTRAAVEVPFVLAALGRATPGGPVVLVGSLSVLAVFTVGAGHPTSVVGGGGGPHPGAVIEGPGWGGPSAPAALVVHASPEPLATGDQDRLMASSAWLSPDGRFVVAAPAGSGGSGLEPALAALADAGWLVARRATASVVDGAWTVGRTADPTADHLVLVELARAAVAG